MKTIRPLFALGFALALAGPATAQSIRSLETTRLPAEDAEPVASTWTVDHIEAPQEIALGTMAIRVWAEVSREGTREHVGELTLALLDDDRRLPLQPLDGALDSSSEWVVATIDTYSWVQDAAHRWEIRAPGQAEPLAVGSVRVRPRVTSPDLVVVDEGGRVQSWLGSGAGGFSLAPPVVASLPAASPGIVGGGDQGGSTVVVPGEDGVVHVFAARGGGRLSTTRTIGVGAGLVDAVVGDLDGDGGADLITAHGDRRIEVRRDLADFPDTILDLPHAPDHVALADLDGDGRPEIWAALLGLADGELHGWRVAPLGAEAPLPGELAEDWAAADWILSPPRGGRGRIRALAPLSRPGGDLLLAVSFQDGEGVLESWGGTADREAVPGPRLERLIRTPGEPLGATVGRFAEGGEPAWLLHLRNDERIELLEVPPDGTPRSRGVLVGDPEVVSALDLDGDGDDDLVAGGEDLRLWINVRGTDFLEAGESPYLLDVPVVAVASGSLDD